MQNAKEKSMNFAQITVSGNVGTDPEIRDVNGTLVANFSIAVNEKYKNSSGEKVEKTHWYRVEAWDGSNGKGLVSNVIKEYVKKGTTVFVQGMPIIEEYEKDGQTKLSFKIKLAGAGSTFRMGGKSDNTKQDSPSTPNTPSNAPVDDIPF
jgi:single-strand DNA-binding protein